MGDFTRYIFLLMGQTQKRNLDSSRCTLNDLPIHWTCRYLYYQHQSWLIWIECFWKHCHDSMLRCNKWLNVIWWSCSHLSSHPYNSCWNWWMTTCSCLSCKLIIAIWFAQKFNTKHIQVDVKLNELPIHWTYRYLY